MEREEFEVIDNCLMVRLPEEIDHHRAGDISQRADWYIVKQNVENVVFDFGDTKFMDSSGIGILLNRYKQMAGSGGTVTIYGVNAQVGRVLAIGGIGRLMKYFDTKEAAIAG